MTPKEALEYQRKGGKLYEFMEFDRKLKYEGHMIVTYIPAVASGGPGDDSGKFKVPTHHRVSK